MSRIRVLRTAGTPKVPLRSVLGVPARAAPTWARTLPIPWRSIMGDSLATSNSRGRTYRSGGSSARSFTCMAKALGMSARLHVATPILAESPNCAYLGAVSTYTFWRFLIQIPLLDSEMEIQYSINGGMKTNFFVPGRCQAMRVAAYSVSDQNFRCLVLS